jgi:hypothetical protein
MERSPVIASRSPTLEIAPRPQAKRYRVRSKWVPGTSDRLELHLLDGGECAEVSVRWFSSQFGREAMDALYLRGKYEFECDNGLWKNIKMIKEQA